MHVTRRQYRRALLHTQSRYARTALRLGLVQRLYDLQVTELGQLRAHVQALGDALLVYQAAVADLHQQRTSAEIGMAELAEDRRGIPHNPL